MGIYYHYNGMALILGKWSVSLLENARSMAQSIFDEPIDIEGAGGGFNGSVAISSFIFVEKTGLIKSVC